ncbi:MAG TPA: hypothetical protein VFH47_00525 [Candidatus Thermoplasmatota archaeon]|nr:hypothetical protein [Candidatus Thermoplasmatota archaeon]
MRRRSIPLAAAAAVLLLALSGCVSNILAPPAGSARDVACRLLRVEDNPLAVLSLEVTPDAPPVPASALEEVAQALRNATGRTPQELRTQVAAAPADAGVDEDTIRAWAQRRSNAAPGTLMLRVLWHGARSDETGTQAAPGALAVSGAAVLSAASRLERPPEDVARAVLLHHLGHALGVVNRGIPVQNPAIQEREASAGHEPDLASVLAEGWERASTAVWVPGATYDRYSEQVVADWRAARDGGACP